MPKFVGVKHTLYNDTFQITQITQFQTLFLRTIYLSDWDMDAKNCGELAGLPDHRICIAVRRSRVCEPDPFTGIVACLMQAAW
jgi:hypothetical protein